LQEHKDDEETGIAFEGPEQEHERCRWRDAEGTRDIAMLQRCVPWPVYVQIYSTRGFNCMKAIEYYYYPSHFILLQLDSAMLRISDTMICIAEYSKSFQIPARRIFGYSIEAVVL